MKLSDRELANQISKLIFDMGENLYTSRPHRIAFMQNKDSEQPVGGLGESAMSNIIQGYLSGLGEIEIHNNKKE